jgi:fatty acid desaturase
MRRRYAHNGDCERGSEPQPSPWRERTAPPQECLPIGTTNPSGIDQPAEPTILTPAEGSALYARLRADVSAAGILDRDYCYYAILLVTVALAMIVSLYFVIRLPVSWPLVAWAVVFSLLAVQCCGIIHDAGHRTVFRSTALNDLLGMTVAGLLGMGFRSWRIQHNAHHAHTNVDGRDPDLDIPLHAFTLRQFQKQTGLWRVAARYQAALFYPMRTLVVFSRRLAEISHFRRQPMSRRLLGEIALWSAGIAAWFILPFLVFPLPKVLLLFVVIHPTMGFYLSNVFAPNHKGMPQIPEGTEISFLEHQIRTSRNITPGWFVDILYIGLNYQIEHHLFPTCPRNKLKQITPFVLEICAQTNMEYTQIGIVKTNRIILGELNSVARAGS